MSGPFKMKGFSYPGEAPTKFKKFANKFLKGKDGKFGWGDVGRMLIPGASTVASIQGMTEGAGTMSGDDFRRSKNADTNTGNTGSNQAVVEAQNEVANLEEDQKNEILTQVVQENKEAEASGDTGAATI